MKSRKSPRTGVKDIARPKAEAISGRQAHGSKGYSCTESEECWASPCYSGRLHRRRSRSPGCAGTLWIRPGPSGWVKGFLLIEALTSFSFLDLGVLGFDWVQYLTRGQMMLGYCISLSIFSFETNLLPWTVRVWINCFGTSGSKNMQLSAMFDFFLEHRWDGGGLYWTLASSTRNHFVCLGVPLQFLDLLCALLGWAAPCEICLPVRCCGSLQFYFGVFVAQPFEFVSILLSSPLWRQFLVEPPLQLTEQGDVLHRQNLSSPARPYGNQCFSSAISFGCVFDGDGEALLHFNPLKQRGGCTVLCGLVPTELHFALNGQGRSGCASAADSNEAALGPDSHSFSVAGMLQNLPITMASGWKSLLRCIHSWILAMLLLTGESAATFFKTLGMICLLYQCRLLAFALRLKGGSCNPDAIIRGLRALCRGAGWHWGLPLAHFSPWQDDLCNQPRRSKRQATRLGFSKDLFLLIMIFCALFGEVSAGSGRSDGLDPTGFRARRRARNKQASLIHLRHVARNLDSPPSSDSEADDHFLWHYFRIFGIGMWSEVMVREFRVGAGIRAVLEMLEVDSQIGQLSVSGGLAPVRGMPLHDYVAAVWVPDWTQHVTGPSC